MRSALVALLALAAVACAEPEPDVSGGFGRPEAREIVLAGAPSEGGPRGPLAGQSASLRQAFTQLHALADTSTAKGLFLRVEPMGGAWGRAADLAGALREIRAAGKPIHCHFERADNVSYWLMATACDRITMTPAGSLNLVGVSAHLFYARDLLSNLGIQAEILAMGRYKSFGETFTEAEMPETTREAMGALLDDYAAALSNALLGRAGGDPARAQALVDGGPYDSERAARAGLVDAAEFDDESRERLREAAKAPRVRRVALIPGQERVGLLDLLSSLSSAEDDEPSPGPHVALVLVEGTIVDGEHPVPGRAVSTPFVEHIRDLARDPDVRAVVIRIDSPGGSALASDRMWHAVRRLAAAKPVMVSIGDVAASGGYYIASAGTRIFAHDTSLVGSIGVLGGKVQLGELARRAGVHPVVLERGSHSAWASPFRGFTDGERELVREMLEASYRRFIGRVALGRNAAWSRVRAAAEGRVHSGRRGRALGLVDETGGLLSALRAARKAGDLPASAPVRQWPEAKSMLETLAEAMTTGQARALAIQAHGDVLPGPLDYAVTLADLLLEAERPLAAAPYLLEVR